MTQIANTIEGRGAYFRGLQDIRVRAAERAARRPGTPEGAQAARDFVAHLGPVFEAWRDLIKAHASSPQGFLPEGA